MCTEKKLELVHFQITKNCNLRCWFCGQWGNKGFFSDASGEAMTFSDWQRVVESLVEYRSSNGISPSVMLWGGEPLTCPDFEKIAKLISQNGFELGMVTNGVLIDKWIDVIKRDFKRIYVSIDGPEAVHDKIRGEGVFGKVSSNLKLLKNSGVEVVAMSVISEELVNSELSEFPYSLEDMGISELILQEMIYLSKDEIESYCQWFCENFGRIPTEIKSWQMEPKADYEKKKRLAIERVFEENYPFKVTYLPHGDAVHNSSCLSPYKHLHIAWNGNVLYCTDFYDFSAGNVKKEDVIDIFNNELSEKYRQQISLGNCATCNHCSWRNSDCFKF